MPLVKWRGWPWPKDIVRKLVSGDLDLGIVGLDTVSEYGQGNEDLILVHDALEFGDCRLSLAIPKYGIFENVNSMKELAQMRQWTTEKPLRVATGFTYLGPKFMKENGVKHVTFSTADGALEAAPAVLVSTLERRFDARAECAARIGSSDLLAKGPLLCGRNAIVIKGDQITESLINEIFRKIGIAEAIVDLVSRGTTLRENNLKEIEGGVILQSQAVLVASRKSLTQRKGVLDITHEILERLEAHLRAIGQFTGPTISPIFCKRDGRVAADYYAIVICVPKKLLYKSEALKKRHEESLEPGAIPLT
ncbi:hypothetical protein HYC85_015226 [Camellia sinensis]|uniref:ATP phosphoribosyltransferase n=1 Tax=Camellia sinensis TaxID=4442 RepID=A0A7J7H004_CAMSI|nr:hypothetical protein HYC85_015226 [Camellia sinensis]